MKDSTKRFYSLLLSFAMALSSLVIYVTMISPSFADIQTLRGERQAKQVRYDDYKKAIELTTTMITRSQGLTVLSDSFNQSIPQTEEVPSMLNQVYGLAKLNNILVGSIDFQIVPTVESKTTALVTPLGKVRATVKGIGSYSDTKNFIKALETNVRIMDISSATIAEGNKKSPVLASTIVIDAYYQPDTTPPTGSKLTIVTAGHPTPGISVDVPSEGVYKITPDFSSTDRLVSLKLSVIDSGLSTAEVPVTVDGADNGKMIYTDGSWIYTPDTAISFAKGTHAIKATFKDKANNSASFTINFTSK